MPSQLDRELDAVFAQLSAPGMPLETVPFKRHGAELPTFRSAPESLPAYFEHWCALHGEKTFIVDGDLRLSFAEAHALAREAAAGLILRHALRQGERVGIAARNSACWVIAYMGVLIAGGCATLLNAWGLGEEMADATALAGCRLLLADPERRRRLEGLAHGAQIVAFDHGPPREGLAALLGAGKAPLPRLRADDLATILFTSGSTAKAKGAVSDHRGVIHGAMNFAGHSLLLSTLLARKGKPITLQPAALVAVPLFHVTGSVSLLLASIAIGRKLVIMPRWDTREAMRLIEAEKITYFVGVPLMSMEIATHPELDRFDLSSCAYFAAGGASRPVGHVQTLRKALPHSYPLLGYGLTETNAVGCGNINENYLARPESTGKPTRPLVELAILDEAGNHLPPGKTGEVAIRSAANFLGYWSDPQATAAAMTADGFFRTGDLGRRDAQGYLTIVDRKKDIIIRGGENISASEVEAAIYAHPAVGEASVFGLPDERLGEVPVAVYVLRQDMTLGEADLKDWLSERLPPHKVPVRLRQQSARLPRLGSQKVDKRMLKSMYSDIWQDA